MEVINILENDNYLDEYIILCNDEWGNTLLDDESKKKKILSVDKVISVLGLVNSDLIGFIALFKYDGDVSRDLCPWYATMYVKDKYRGLGYSKILNKSIIDEVKRLGYSKVYLKTDLVNYYEKFGFSYLEDLNNGEKLYYMEVL